MPSYKSFWSSLVYHNVTAPAIRKTGKLYKKGVEYLKRRSKIKQGINPDARKNVLKKTRGTTASNGRLWSKNTLSGQKRRQAAAHAARAIPRPKRRHNGSLVASSPSKVPHVAPKASPAKVALTRSAPKSSVTSAVNTSQTHGQLRRKLTGMAVRKATRMVGGKSRTERARNIKALRKAVGPEIAMKGLVKSFRHEHQKEAASVLAKRHKKP